MFILSILFVFFLLSLILSKIADLSDVETFLFKIRDEISFSSGISGFVIFVLLLTIVFNYNSVNTDIVEFESFKEEVKYADSIDINIDGEIYRDVIKWNNTIEEWKFKNNSILESWYPDKVNELEKIRL